MLDMYDPPIINKAQSSSNQPQKQYLKERVENYTVGPSNNQGVLNSFMKDYLTNVQWQQQQ